MLLSVTRNEIVGAVALTGCGGAVEQPTSMATASKGIAARMMMAPSKNNDRVG
jgi:hypothetical protein